MAGRELKSARTVAMIVLNQLDPRRDYAGRILDNLLPQTSRRQQATDLVYGTIRNRMAIDMLITRLADCPIEKISTPLLNIIRIGAYELFYSPQTADYAIVNEAVENASAVAGQKQVGFVNAVLRQITRRIQNRQKPLTEADVKRMLPQNLSTGCEFDSDILPDVGRKPVDYLSTVFSLPRWLIIGWIADFGEEKTRQICFASNRKPSIYLRPNSLKTTPQELQQLFRQAEIDCEITETGLLKLKNPKAIAKLPGFDKGLFSVQDVTSWQAVKALALAPKPAKTILDLCAAPGGKTTQLAEETGDKARIIATDIDAERLRSVKVAAYETLHEVIAEIGLFDYILLDVPCSNTGVLAKRPEVRYRITKNGIADLTGIQAGLLKQAPDMLKPKGRICYSTCSIEKRENGLLVSDFLSKNPALELESECLTLPSAWQPDHDGGY
ncbi:MAG: transcription antitermination factor NusB, partial [Planctomycetota bacterium]